MRFREVFTSTRKYVKSAAFEKRLDRAIVLLKLDRLSFINLNEGKRPQRIRRKLSVLGGAGTLILVSFVLTKLPPTVQKHVAVKIVKVALKDLSVISHLG